MSLQLSIGYQISTDVENCIVASSWINTFLNI